MLKKYPKYGQSLWIVKPGENTNRGCGIQVSRDLNHIKSLIQTTQVNGHRRSYIVQKYIERPLLYKNRKFDIRCFSLCTSVNGNLQGYWYSDGYLRTSCREYNLKNATNRMIHLTNDAVQKKSEDYGKFESGNKVSKRVVACRDWVRRNNFAHLRCVVFSFVDSSPTRNSRSTWTQAR